jgi:hypothetical protein
LTALLQEAGFEITAAYGLNHLGDCLARGEFDPEVVAQRHGVYADITNSQLLAYVSHVP